MGYTDLAWAFVSVLVVVRGWHIPALNTKAALQRKSRFPHLSFLNIGIQYYSDGGPPSLIQQLTSVVCPHGTAGCVGIEPPVLTLAVGSAADHFFLVLSEELLEGRSAASLGLSTASRFVIFPLSCLLLSEPCKCDTEVF